MRCCYSLRLVLTVAIVGVFSLTHAGNRDRLRRYVNTLASPEMKGRFPGTQGDSLSASFIAQEMQKNGLCPLKDHSFVVPFTAHTRQQKSYATSNVIGCSFGCDDILKNEWIIVGAHYDHLGYGGRDSGSRTPDTLAIHCGADDNASGVAAMLCQSFDINCLPLRRSVLFVAFGAEELGVQGSKWVAERLNKLPLPTDSARFVAMVNLDMVGNLRNKSITVAGSGTSVESDSLIHVAAEQNGLNVALSSSGVGPSDHTPFYAKQLPVFFITTGATLDYHTPRDKAENLNYAGMDSVVCFSESLLRAIDRLDTPLHFKEAGDANAKPMRARFKVTLGLMPDVAGVEKRGLRADIVVKDKPAYKAGMKNGDIIVEIDGTSVRDLEEYMKCLGKLKPATVIPVKVIRADKMVVLQVDLTKNK